MNIVKLRMVIIMAALYLLSHLFTVSEWQTIISEFMYVCMLLLCMYVYVMYVRVMYICVMYVRMYDENKPQKNKGQDGIYFWLILLIFL